MESLPAKKITKLKDFSILCVEDEDIVRETLVDFLGRRFKEVIPAIDGEDGLEKFKKYSPDLVVSDVVMPKLNGLRMAKMIKDLNPKTPIIISSAFDSSELLLEAINIGIDGYVVKPINDKKLVFQIDKAILALDFERIKSDVIDKENLLKVVSENSPAGIALFNENITYANSAFTDISGYRNEELSSLDFIEFIKANNESMNKVNSINDLSSLKEIKISTKDGEIKHIELAINPINYQGNRVYVLNILDISARKWYELELENNRRKLEELNIELKDKNRELKDQLYIDELTSLPNRLKLLKDAFSSKDAILMLINIDSFKEINDFYGTEFGDYVIKEVANKLKNLSSDTGFMLYKLQADEYALFCNSCGKDDVEVENIAKDIHDSVERNAFVQKGQEIHVGVTVGVAHGSSKDLMPRADIALKRAKKSRNPFLMYDDSMMAIENYEENFKWINMLKSALEEERVVSFFQPIMDNKSMEISKYECLVRLIGKDGAIYSPYLFLDISKKSRLYQKITKLMVGDAFDTFKDSPHSFSVNLSIEDILNQNNVDFIVENIKKYNNSNRLIFEVLESEGIENYEEVAEFINVVKSMGCKVAIDDFGSGYSNFAHILKLNIDYIKIDASIIKNSDVDENSQIISKTIVKFSQEMGIKTVAEFVHSKDVLKSVIGFGVDFSQGYFIGKPKREISPKSEYFKF